MKKISRLIALLLCAAMLFGMVPTIFAVDGTPVPTGDTADEQWQEIQDIISQYYGEWTTPNYPGAVNNRIPNTALLGNGDVGISSAGNDSLKSFNISMGDFWEYNGSPLKVGTISVGSTPEDDGNLARDYSKVTTSSGSGSLAVNGRSSTPDDGYMGWVSTTTDTPQWLALEFDEAITFNTWTLRNGGYADDMAGGRITTVAAELQISDNGTDWETISSFSDNTLFVTKIVLDEMVTTKHVRLLVTKPCPDGGDGYTRIPQFILSVTEVDESEAVNLAPTYKNVTADSTNSTYVAANAVNGLWDETLGFQGWSSGVGKTHWLMLEFEEEITFDRWVVRNDGAARPTETARNTSDCELQISEDGVTWTTVSTVVGNTANVIDITMDEKVTTKWVRLYITKPTQETTTDTQNNPRAIVGSFELYDTPEVYNVNIAPHYAAVYASSTNSTYVAANAVTGTWDASLGFQGWASGIGKTQWLMLDMGKNVSFNRWVIQNDGAQRPAESARNTSDCQLQIWTGEGAPTGSETEGWTDVDKVVGNTANTIDRRLSETATARYIRLYITKPTQETTTDTQNNPRAIIGSFELYNMSEDSDDTVTEESTNVALGATVYTCGQYNANYAGNKMVDGVITGDNKWCCTNSACNGTHWAIVDLKAEYTLTSIQMAHSGAMGDIYAEHNTVAYEIQYLDTVEEMTEADLKAATGWKTAVSVTGNTATYTTDDITSDVTARYVRLYITDASNAANGDKSSRINELEIYGHEPLPEETNVALGAKIFACGCYNNDTTWDCAQIVDGVINTQKWCCNCGGNNINAKHWAILDLEDVYALNSFYLVNSGIENAATHNTPAFEIQYLETTKDMTQAQLKAVTSWKTAASVTNNTATYVEGDLVSGVEARYVRLYINKADNSNGHARIYELELYGYMVEDLVTEEETNPEKVIPFNEKQDILNAEVVTEQNLADIPMHIESWMSATNNLFVMEITSLAEFTTADVVITLDAYVNGGRPTSAVVGEDYLLVTRSTGGASASNAKSHTSKVAMATRVIGAEGIYETDGSATGYLTLKLPAGETVYVVTAICGGGQTYDCNGNLWEGREEPVTEALALLNTIGSKDDVDTLHTAHLNWWKDYWMQSYISLDTSDADLATLQKYYYAAQYELGSSIREGKVASGLYGIWHTTDTPSWASDYHLNYNFISTYYGLGTSNRVSMIRPAVEAIWDYVPVGLENAAALANPTAAFPRSGDARMKQFAEELIAKGQIDPVKGIENAILYPVAILPWGMSPYGRYYLSETLDAPFSAVPLIEYYNFTQDKEFMEDTLYVYLTYVLNFLEHWLVKEDSQYVLYAAYNEGSWAKNAGLELMAYKLCLKYGIQIAEELGDTEKAAKWQDIYDNMADQPIIEDYRGTGKTVLGLADLYQPSAGAEWIELTNLALSGGNVLPLESTVPFEVFGYYSTDEQLQILQNTVEAYGRDHNSWAQINSFPKIYVAAVNSRYDCRTIVSKFAATIRAQMKANLMIEDNVHGIEKAGATEAINNMLLLSDQGVIKLFGNWLADKDAKFVRLRASGAFVFSAEYDGEAQEVVEGATMYSEAGATATVASLWPEGMTVLDENGNVVKTTQGTAPNHEEEITYTFETEAGKTYTFVKKISVTGVTLDAESVTLVLSDLAANTAELTATIDPETAHNQNVTWTSSDESVVVVDENGGLRAVGVGEATITVTTEDGQHTDTCTVTVVCKHVLSDYISDGNGKHYQECTVEGCDHVTEAVDCVGAGGDCTTDAVCPDCGYVTHEAEGHVLSDYICDGNGNHHKECTVEGCDHTEEPEACEGEGDCVTDAICTVCGGVIKEAEGHKLEKVEHKDATYEEEGNIEHYICSVCGKYFSDAEGENEIEPESVIIPKLEKEPEEEKPEEDEPTEEEPEDEENPKTGDNLWVSVVAMLSSAAALPITKRRNRK